MAQSQRPHQYHTFILRLWQESGVTVDDSATWRVSLEDPHSAERIGFKSIDELHSFLARWATSRPPQGFDPCGTP